MTGSSRLTPRRLGDKAYDNDSLDRPLMETLMIELGCYQ
jgi:hypothetical protein